MLKTNKLSDHVGKHEKTKVIVRLQGTGSGPPVRFCNMELSTSCESNNFDEHKSPFFFLLIFQP